MASAIRSSSRCACKHRAWVGRGRQRTELPRRAQTRRTAEETARMSDRGCSYLRAHGEAESLKPDRNPTRTDKPRRSTTLTSDLQDVRAADQPPIVHVPSPTASLRRRSPLLRPCAAAVGHARSGPGATCCSPCPPSDVAPGSAAAPDEHTAQAYQARLLLGLRGVTEGAPLIPLRARRKEATPRCSCPCDHRSQGCGWPRSSSSTSSSGRNATRSHARSAQL